MFSFILQFYLLKQTLCVALRPLTCLLYITGVKDVWVRGFDEGTIERWSSNYLISEYSVYPAWIY
jgi:hypothetical protein